MSTLFEITNEFQELYSMLTDPDADVECINDTLDALTGELEVKSAGYVAVIHQLEMEQQKAEELSKALKAKADIRKNNEAPVTRGAESALHLASVPACLCRLPPDESC